MWFITKSRQSTSVTISHLCVFYIKNYALAYFPVLGWGRCIKCVKCYMIIGLKRNMCLCNFQNNTFTWYSELILSRGLVSHVSWWSLFKKIYHSFTNETWSLFYLPMYPLQCCYLVKSFPDHRNQEPPQQHTLPVVEACS